MDSELSAALRRGATVITGNARLARSIRTEFGRTLGTRVWAEPQVLPWGAWIEREWQDLLYAGKARPLLRPRQEAALWERIIREHPQGDDLIDAPAAGALAQEAWGLAQDWELPWGPDWSRNEDGAAFVAWAETFAKTVREMGRMDRARLDSLVASRLEVGKGEVWFAGFDEMTPRQKTVLRHLEQSGREVTVLYPADAPGNAIRVELPDVEAEAEAAAAWARDRLRAGGRRIGVIFSQLGNARNAVDRVFRSALGGEYHLSLGPALSARPLIAGALGLLELGGRKASFNTLSKALLSPFVGGAPEEASSRAQFDVSLRASGLTSYDLRAVARMPGCPAEFGARLRRLAQMREEVGEAQGPQGWAAYFAQFLAACGWPGDAPLSSTEFQLAQRWQELLTELASLELVWPEMTWSAALRTLRQIAGEVEFEVENRGQPVQVMGVLEAAGAESDHLWIGGMDEEAWPGGASPNPFVPRSLQREHGLPLGSPGRRLELARKITRRLMASAPEVVVSHANRSGDREVRVSPLFQQVPRKLGETTRFQLWQRRPAPMQELDDQTAPEVTRGVAAQGGVRTIQLQAACPFRAFGEIRLRAGQVKRPDQGLDPQKRGVLLHRMLERCWRELRSLDALRKLNAWELKALVERAAGEAVAKEEFDARMKELETRRLSRIALDWLQLERERKVDFEVEQFERQRQVSLGGLDLDTRIDRVDKLEDGRRVLIDYKSSTPSPAQWNGERPEDPQIPVYAASMAEPLAGALFAQVRPGHLKFSGIASMKDLVPDIRAVSDQKFAEKVSEWKTVVEKLAAAYAGGRAEVDPKEKSKTCQRCHLATLCRIHEKAMREDG